MRVGAQLFCLEQNLLTDSNPDKVNYILTPIVRKGVHKSPRERGAKEKSEK